MRPLQLVLFLALTTSTFAQQKPDSLLHKAYKTKSLSELRSFFNEWANETPTITSKEFDQLNDTAENVYRIFEAFYNPKDIEHRGGSEWGNDIYKHVQYLIMQDKIYFNFTSELIIDSPHSRETFALITAAQDSIINFRPRLATQVVKGLLLTDSYKKTLERFLGNTHSELGAIDISTPALAQGESRKRMVFLEHFIKIWYGHWGGYWQFISYPEVTSITFDAKMENAILYFTMIYEGGEAYMKKIDNKWVVINARRTWIE